jgi:cytochrome c553
MMAAMLPAGSAQAADAAAIEEQALACAGCHGEAGVPTEPNIPVIWGQHEGYLYLQLRDYKLGPRKNEIMNGIAAEMSRDDMRALAAYFAKKPWPRLPGQRDASAADVARAERAAGAGLCKECHLGGYVGDSTIPRLAGQSQAYLDETLLAFKTKARGNNPAMSSLVGTYPDEDLKALAIYLGALTP